MMKFGQHFLAVAVCAASTGAIAADPAVAIASLDDISGKILINKGKGFVSAKPGMEVRPGDRVIALDNASARIVYRNGCVTSLRENSLLAMDGSGCDKRPVNSRAQDIRLAAAIGGEVVNTGGVQPAIRPVPLAGFTPQAALITFGTIGGVIVVRSATQSDDKPVSGQ